MSSFNASRLLIHPPFSGAMNMAVDEFLLNAGTEGTSALRFYEWSSPTISLGHFQAVAGSSVPERFSSLDRVRRLSGGGAILHHHELTYSCVIPASHPVASEPVQLYDLVHEAIINVLTAQKVPCQLRGDAAFADQSFLCFSRGDARDIVSGAHKIVGSAQRRRQGAILQHGSILLKRSELAPEFPGIEDLTGVSLSAEILVTLLIPAIAARLELPLEKREFSPEEWAAIRQQAANGTISLSGSTIERQGRADCQ